MLSEHLSNKSADGRPLQLGGDLLPSEWNLDAINIIRAHKLRRKYNNVFGRAISRERMLAIANDTLDPMLQAYATCDLRWVKILSITSDGVEETFDFTVPDGANFIADGFVVHNSQAEQHSDKLFGLWRPALTEELKPGEQPPLIEIDGSQYEANERLLVLRMLKQRGDSGRHTFALHMEPELLELAELETRRLT